MNNNKELYLDLMIRCLTNTIYEDPGTDPWCGNRYLPVNRLKGTDWPSQAHTMIGVERLINLKILCQMTIDDKIPGDFIETGVWRGGATILMRAILKANNITDKLVWVADSFEGLPKPNEELYPHDSGDLHYTFDQLKVSLEDVQNNFRKYNLLDKQVKFLKGWFKDTLPTAPINRLSILRLDGDLYESTMDSLEALYSKLCVGGFVILDDFNSVEACQHAMFDFRKKYNITDDIYRTNDQQGVFWRKS